MKLMVGRIGGAVLAFAALVPPSEAQEVLQSPDAIRACLCQEQAVASLSAALRQDSESYDARQNELRALDERYSEVLYGPVAIGYLDTHVLG